MHRFAIGLFILALLLLTGCGLALNQPSVAPPSTPSAAPATAEGTDCTKVPGACETENLLTTFVTYLTFFAELCGAFVIGVGVIRAIGSYLPHVLTREATDAMYAEDIRLRFGKSLALALEFELGADILKTAVVPSLQIIAQLAAIIILRTLLNYFLERELRLAEQRRSGQHLAANQPEVEVKP